MADWIQQSECCPPDWNGVDLDDPYNKYLRNKFLNEIMEIIRLPMIHDFPKLKEVEPFNNTEELAPHVPSGFYFDSEDGHLFYQKGPDDTPTRLCSRLEVTARTHDEFHQNQGRIVRFHDRDNHCHILTIPMKALVGDGKIVMEEFMSRGLELDNFASCNKLIVKYIQDADPKTIMRCVSKTGWHEKLYVLPDETIGNHLNQRVVFQSQFDLASHYSSKGRLEDWKQIPALCAGNPLLILSLSAAFAAPLLYPMQQEGGGLHFRGPSSTGKTTLLRVANSVYGAPQTLQSWRTTSNGLEGIAVSYNDSLLCLDEIGEMNVNEAGNIAYMLSNGKGKGRAHKFGAPRPRYEWRLLFLSSGEIGLAETLRQANQIARGGQEVRILDIPINERPYGCFDAIHHLSSPSAFANELKKMCEKIYGEAGKVFIRLFVANQDDCIQWMHHFIGDLRTVYLPQGACGQTYRAFDRFALIACAGELASHFQITGWKLGEAREAIMSCFREWRALRGSTEMQEEKVVMDRVRHFFEAYGDSRFQLIGGDDYRIPLNRAGFRRGEADERVYFVLPEIFHQEICKGLDPSFVIKVCIKHRLLRPAANGKPQRSEYIGTKERKSVYAFTSAVLAEGQEDGHPFEESQ